VQPKTIAFLLPDLRGGGAERVAVRLMRHFRAAGHKVEFVVMQRAGELLHEVPDDVRIVELGATRVRNAIGPLVRYFRENKPDAVQARMWPLTVVAILARALTRSRTRLVVSDHAALSRHFAGRRFALAVVSKSIRFFYPKADARLVVAEALADDLAGLAGLRRDAFTVIYNPVDAPPVPLEVPPAIEQLWGDAQKRIVTVGSLKAQKNHALLIRSFARLDRAGAKLMIVGSGPLEAELKRLAASLGIADRVILPGFTPDPWPYYASADLFVLSSDYEGYPNVLVEAMRCGLAVVSTDCESGPREILDGGRYGRLVPVGDEKALAEAMAAELAGPHDPDLVRKRAEELSGANTAERYLDLLIGPQR
jgi:glycosyltransferase involved in cell wall biosynthesis